MNIILKHTFLYFVWKYVLRKWKEKVDTLIDECTQNKRAKVATFLYGFTYQMAERRARQISYYNRL